LSSFIGIRQVLQVMKVSKDSGPISLLMQIWVQGIFKIGYQVSGL